MKLFLTGELLLQFIYPHTPCKKNFTKPGEPFIVYHSKGRKRKIERLPERRIRKVSGLQDEGIFQETVLADFAAIRSPARICFHVIVQKQ